MPLIVMCGNPCCGKTTVATKLKQYFETENARKCQATAYCVAHSRFDYQDDYCDWWLNNASEGAHNATSVSSNGYIILSGYRVTITNAVRPALFINLLGS